MLQSMGSIVLQSTGSIVLLLWLICLGYTPPALGQSAAPAPPVAPVSLAAARAQQQQMPVEAARETLAAASLNSAEVPYRVLLPVGYALSQRRYPVLYLLHGLTGNENDWITKTNLSGHAAPYPLIIVMPGVGDSWYANSAGDPQARYEDAIVRDLIAHIDKRFRTIADWHGRAIAGLSMGGLGTMKFALRYPQFFAFAASFSGAFEVPRTDFGTDASTDARAKEPRVQNLRRIYGAALDSETRRQNDVFAIVEQVTPERTRLPYLYVATGANDPLPAVMPSNARFADRLRERKLRYEYHERPGVHDWLFWDTEVKAMLQRLGDFVPLQP